MEYIKLVQNASEVVDEDVLYYCEENGKSSILKPEKKIIWKLSNDIDGYYEATFEGVMELYKDGALVETFEDCYTGYTFEAGHNYVFKSLSPEGTIDYYSDICQYVTGLTIPSFCYMRNGQFRNLNLSYLKIEEGIEYTSVCFTDSINDEGATVYLPSTLEDVQENDYLFSGSTVYFNGTMESFKANAEIHSIGTGKDYYPFEFATIICNNGQFVSINLPT